MIQRVQSIFLLLAAGCCALLLYLPIYKGPPFGLATDYVYLGDQLEIELADVLVGVLCIVTIFFFKKRLRQQKNCFIIIALSILLQVLIGVIIFSAKQSITDGSIQPSAFLPIVAAACAYLAFRFIRKDEELIRSSERMR